MKIIKSGVLSVFYILIFSISAWATGVRVSAVVSENQPMLGEQIRFTIEVRSTQSVQVQRPQISDIPGFRLRSPVPSTSTSYSLVNNEATLTYGFTYVLIAEQAGQRTIPAISVVVDGSTYQTDPLTVTVHDSQNDRQATQSRNPDIFLRKEISDENPVTGQQLIVDITLYFRDSIEINSYQVTRGWSTEGFWQEDLSSVHTARAETIFLDGVRYRRAVLVRHAIFPTRSGELRLNPYHIRASIRASTRGFDAHGSLFAQGFGRSQNIELQTEPKVLRINPIPRANEGQFINAVGEFEIRRFLSQEQVAIGESVEIITEISGRGNLNLISRPGFAIPEDFDVFRPQETTELVTLATHVEGTRTFRDVLIARRVGAFTVPADTLMIYDDVLRQAKVVILPELSLRVTRDPNARIGFVSNGDVVLTPVTGLANWQRIGEGKSALPKGVRIGLGAPFLFILLAMGWYWYEQKMKTDTGFARRQTAREKATQKLKIAEEHVANGHLKEAYSFIHQAVYGCISDRLNLPEAGKSDREITAYLHLVKVPQPLVEAVFRLLDKCSGIRFAPKTSEADVRADIAEAQRVIQNIIRETST